MFFAFFGVIGVLLAAALIGRAIYKQSQYAEDKEAVLGWQFIDYRPDVSYDDAESSSRSLDLFLPREGRDWPVAVVVHGGSFIFNSKDTVANLGIALARHDVAAAVVNYRLVPKTTPQGQVEDVARAVAWTYKNIAALGGDPERLYLVGHSAGAFLAAMVALDPEKLAACGLQPDIVRGAALLSGFYNANQLPRLQKFLFGTSEEKRLRNSPLSHLRADTPELLIMHAEFEMMEPVPLADASREFYEAVVRVGGRARLLVVPEVHHRSIIGLVGRRPNKTLGPLLRLIKGSEANGEDEDDQDDAPLPST